MRKRILVPVAVTAAFVVMPAAATAVTQTVYLANAVTFTTPGTYTYHCLIHPFMHGTIIVQ